MHFTHLFQYPQYDERLDDPESEAAYELILGCSKGVRSLIAEYKIEGAKGESRMLGHFLCCHTNMSAAYVQTSDARTHETASSQLQSIKSLSGKHFSSITILSPSDPAPTGSAVYAVSASTAVFLDVRGHVNIDEEISKAQQKMKKASDSAAKQKKLIGSDEFKQKVSAAVQEEEQKKLDEFVAVQQNYEKTIAQFQTLKLESKE